MLILTSPAKTLDYSSVYHSPITSTNPFLDKSEQIVNVLKKQSSKQLQKTLQVSPKLADLNYERYQNWDKNHTLKNSREAIFAYNGDIFAPMTPETYTEKQSEYMQRSLRIISGLYGLVRPYDLIQPYRLEMKAKVRIHPYTDLYSFWTSTLTDFLNEDIKKNGEQYVINLASDEYGKVINFKALKAPTIIIEFRQKDKNGLRNVGIISKRARGLMIEYMTKNMVSTLENLKKFDYEGYSFYKSDDRSLWFVK